MRGKLKWRLLTGIIIGILPVVVLYLHSENFHKNKNSFNRTFPSHIILKTQVLNIGDIHGTIIGRASNTVYIDDYKKPSNLFIADMNLTDTQSIHLALPDLSIIDSSQIMIRADSPNLFMVDKLTSSVFICNEIRQGFFKTLKKFQFSSSEAAIVSGESAIIRTYQRNSQNSILAKLKWNQHPFLDTANILEKQVDGFFCTDGNLLIDRKSKRLIYTYFYRNRFLCLDSNLQIIYSAKTIDTNTRSKIQVRTVHDQKILAAPPVVVNELAAFSGKSILVCSALIADNEEIKSFRNNIVVDVYDSENGHYRFSFYLPKINDNRITSLVLEENKLFTIQGHSVVRYDLDL
jgi:hypothetical protein